MFLTSKFSYLLFPNPTPTKLKFGRQIGGELRSTWTNYDWPIRNREHRSTNQIVFIIVLFGFVDVYYGFYQPQQPVYKWCAKTILLS
jgi:hypothetical protein